MSVGHNTQLYALCLSFPFNFCQMSAVCHSAYFFSEEKHHTKGESMLIIMIRYQISAKVFMYGTEDVIELACSCVGRSA